MSTPPDRLPLPTTQTTSTDTAEQVNLSTLVAENATPATTTPTQEATAEQITDYANRALTNLSTSISKGKFQITSFPELQRLQADTTLPPADKQLISRISAEVDRYIQTSSTNKNGTNQPRSNLQNEMVKALKNSQAPVVTSSATPTETPASNSSQSIKLPGGWSLKVDGDKSTLYLPPAMLKNIQANARYKMFLENQSQGFKLSHKSGLLQLSARTDSVDVFLQAQVMSAADAKTLSEELKKHPATAIWDGKQARPLPNKQSINTVEITSN